MEDVGVVWSVGSWESAPAEATWEIGEPGSIEKTRDYSLTTNKHTLTQYHYNCGTVLIRLQRSTFRQVHSSEIRRDFGALVLLTSCPSLSQAYLTRGNWHVEQSRRTGTTNRDRKTVNRQNAAINTGQISNKNLFAGDEVLRPTISWLVASLDFWTLRKNSEAVKRGAKRFPSIARFAAWKMVARRELQISGKRKISNSWTNKRCLFSAPFSPHSTVLCDQLRSAMAVRWSPAHSNRDKGKWQPLGVASSLQRT